MTTTTTRTARLRVGAAAAITLAGVVLSSGAAAVSYRSADDVSGRHVRNTSASTSVAPNVAVGRLTFR